VELVIIFRIGSSYKINYGLFSVAVNHKYNEAEISFIRKNTNL